MVLLIQSQTLTFQKNRLVCFNESALKITKNTFYLTLQDLFIPKLFKVLSYLNFQA